MLSEYITSLEDVSFHIVAYTYARFRYSGKNPMRFAVFWRISVRFCGFRTPPPLTPPSTWREEALRQVKYSTNFLSDESQITSKSESSSKKGVYATSRTKAATTNYKYIIAIIPTR